MSRIIDFDRLAAESNTNNNTRSGNRPFAGQNNPQERVDAKIWGNLGYQIGDTFITLPLGFPVDTMREMDVRGQNEDYVMRAKASNALLKQMVAAGAKLQPGEEHVIFKQEVGPITWMFKIRRVKEALNIAEADNKYAVDLGAIFAAGAASEEEYAAAE